MAMSMDQMRVAMQAATAGQKARLVFKREDVADVMYLVNAVQNRMVEVRRGDELTLRVIMQSHDWGGDRNRTVEMTILPAYSAEYFEGRLLRRIEKFEVVQ